MLDTKTASEAEAQYVLEEPRRLSRSMLWHLQRNFFEHNGTAAWGDGIVPSYVTTNPFIANAYARVVLGFLRDWNASGILDRSQPVYLVELGSGAGRLAFNLLKKFTGSLSRSGLRDLPVKYVMTDFTQKNLDFWERHYAFDPFLESGNLDFALFDAEHPEPLTLQYSGEVLAPGEVKNPIVLVANYLFDSIPQDAFYIQDGQLQESLLKLASTQPEPDLEDPGLLQRVTLIYHREPACPDYYENPEFNRLLEFYRQQLNETALDFPIAALECLRFFRQLGQDRLLLLSGDKGYDRAEDLAGRKEPGYAVHGSFSMMVNYHALGQYCLNQGGQVLRTSYQYAGLNILAFLLGRQDYVETRHTFYEAIENQGPDDFFNVTQAIESHLASFSLEQNLALIRFSGWDTRVFLKCFPTLLDQVSAANEDSKRELHLAIGQVWDNYYHVGEGEDVVFDLGMLLDKLGAHEEAITYFQRSLQLFGPAPSTFYNKAVCHYKLKQFGQALECANQALLLNPDFELAQKLLRTIVAESLKVAGA